MPKTIISFNAEEQVAEKLIELRKAKKNQSKFINDCILESTKPKPNEEPIINTEIRNMRIKP